MKNSITQIKFHLALLMLLLSHSLFSTNTTDKNSDLQNKATSWIKNQPVQFLENKGQMTDMKKNPVPFVLFKAEAPGVDMYITEKGLTYVFIKAKDETSFAVASNKFSATEKATEDKFSYEWSRVDMVLKNANIKKENCIKEGASENVSHYYVGHSPNPIRDVHSFEKITFKDIYPGIDWVLYNSSDKGFKYDFIIHPNADASQIKLIYEGDGKLEAKNNNIHFENSIGELYEGKLFCYQGSESIEVESKYAIKKNQETRNKNQDGSDQQLTTNNPQPFSYEIGIQLNQYDKSKPLIIDPQVVWASYVGGNGSEGPVSITSDPNNNVLITGYQSATDFPTLNPGGGAFFQGVSLGGPTATNGFIMKFDNNGVLFWATFITADRGASATTIASDLLGNCIIVGSTTSTNFPTFNPGGGAYYQGARVDSVEAFIMKFNAAGVLTWGTYYGGDSSDVATTVHVDAFNNIYVVGASNSLNLPLQNGGGYYQATNAGRNDGILLKFNNNGVRQHATFFGGSGTDMAHAITSDAAGNIFFTGQSDSPNLPVLNPGGGAYYQPATAGTTDVFIVRLTNTLTLNWSTFYGGTAIDATTSITCDQTGNIFLGGYSLSPTIPLLNPGGGAYFQAANAGNQDAFILKFSNTGTQLWSTFYGGSGMDYFKTPFNNLTVDLCNNVYLTFATMSNDMPTQASCDVGYNPLTLKGPADCFILKFSNGGVRMWAVYMGGDGFDFRESNCVDKLGNFFMTGEWHTPVSQASYPVITPSASSFYDPTHNSGDDGYIIKFSPTVISLTPSSTNAGCFCTGTATVTATGGCAPYQYLWYNSSWTQIGNTQTISNLCAGTYHAIVRDSMACSLPDTVTVILTGGGPPVTSTQNPVICVGGNYTLPGGTIVSTAGTYVDTVQLGNGCDSIITTILTTNNFVTSSQSPTICAGQSYTLPDGSLATTAGTYTDTLTAIIGGCDSIITTTLAVTPAATFAQSINICIGTTYTLPGGTVVGAAGIYLDTLSTTAGCDSVITTTLTLSPALTASQSATLCNGNSFLLPDGTSVNTAGVYLDTVTAQGGCDSIITTTINVKPNSTSTQSHSMCSGNTFILPGGTVVTTSGIYLDTLISFNGCDSVITTTVTVNPSPSAGTSVNVSILIGATTTLTASGGGTYSWYPPTGLDNTTNSTVVATPSETTTYCVEVTSANGCKDTACVTVSVEIPCPDNANLDIPNAFSPNEDGVNDDFCLQGWTPCNEEFTIFIFDRWGEKVFESKDPNFCWDGKHKGTTMDAQVFVYYIKARFYNFDKVVDKKGNISLIR